MAIKSQFGCYPMKGLRKSILNRDAYITQTNKNYAI